MCHAGRKARQLAYRTADKRSAIAGEEKNLTELLDQIKNLRDSIKQAETQRNNLQTQLVKATDDVNNKVAERQRLEKLNGELAAQILQLKNLVAWAHVTPADPTKSPPPGTEGEVTAVPRPNVIEISLGADDGVAKGHQFVVTRPSTGKYICKIEVIQVDSPYRAVCRPVPGSESDKTQKGDHVKAYTQPR